VAIETRILVKREEWSSVVRAGQAHDMEGKVCSVSASVHPSRGAQPEQ
jgi:hypothetical protein